MKGLLALLLFCALPAHSGPQEAAMPAAMPAAVPPPISLSLTSPFLGQAPSPSLLSGAGEFAGGIWQSARQAAASFFPVLGFAPERETLPPPALPPSFLPQEGAPAPTLGPTQASVGLPAQSSRGQAARPGAAVLPGGILPLRSSEPGVLPAIGRRPLSLAAKAEALKAPLQALGDLAAGPSDASSERASRAGRMISDIVSDESSAPGAVSGPRARAEDPAGWTRDAMADYLPAQGAGGATPGVASPRAARLAGGSAASATPAAAAFAQAVDAADTLGGSGFSATRGRRAGSAAEANSSRDAVQVRRVDPALLVVQMLDRVVVIARAAEARLLSPGSWLAGLGQEQTPLLRPGRSVSAADTPVYALGARGPEAGEQALLASRDSASDSGRAASQTGVFAAPDSSILPRSIPAGVFFGLLLPLLGVALFYLREFRR